MNCFQEIMGHINAAAIVTGLVLGVYWVMWLIWCWVVPHVYASGPPGLLEPGFWFFAACVSLLLSITSIFAFRRK